MVTLFIFIIQMQILVNFSKFYSATIDCLLNLVTI